MSFRFAVGGISHETNTYCKEPTPITDFKILRGDQILDTFKGVRFYIGGMIDAARDLGATLVPVYFAQATPSGTIALEAYNAMVNELLAGIKAVLPLDGVALALHGAGVVESIPDLEGHLCKAVRELVGPKAKIVVTLDLHGNITQAMADQIDMCLGVHYYPHTDGYERGVEAVNVLAQLLAGKLHPVIHVERIPAILTAATTNLYPANAVNELCWEVEKRPGVLDCTFFHGFARSDIPNTGAQIIAHSARRP
ncbi:MAG: M81 family metallopeptidase [Bacillota bacterium]|nr:M81 family metallopeptidase [Bacillota bacterium]